MPNKSNNNKKELLYVNNNNYKHEQLSKRVEDIELKISEFSNNNNNSNDINDKNKDIENDNNEIYYIQKNNCCDLSHEDVSNCFKSTSEYSEEIIMGEKCKGINIFFYLFGTLCGAIPLGFGFALVTSISTNNIYIPWIIIISCITATVMSFCLFCIFKLIVKNTEEYNYGAKFDIKDTCFSCCININHSDQGVDLNMFVYIFCFLIIGIPLGIAFKFMIFDGEHNYTAAGWICTVSAIVWLIFLSLIIIVIKLFRSNQE